MGAAFRNRSTVRARIVPLFSLLLLLLLLDGSSSQRPSRGRVVFPPVDDLAIGDPCTIAPSPSTGVPYARDGICRQVRDCATFVPRIILEPFDIRRDVCYFEVHDPVVCCVTQPPSSGELQLAILRKRLAARDDEQSSAPPFIDDTNMIY